MKDVQQAGATRDIEDLRVGDERQLTIDMSNWDIRVHDGVTPGGHRVLNRDNNNTRYQIKNPELDGLVFADEAKGFLVRFGPGDYGLRVLTTSDASLTVTYGDGQIGDAAISLASEILSDHTFSGAITFNSSTPVSFVHGLTGDLTGDTTGTHTGDVNGDCSGNHNGTFTGSVDVSANDLILAPDQIEMVSINGLAAALAGAVLQSNFVMLWTGAVVDIPVGWYLCDGSNGTPDLRGLFVLGAGGAYDVGDTGGSENHGHTVTITPDGVHSHTATGEDFTLTNAEIPAHWHGSGVCDTSSAPAFNHGTIAAAPIASDNVETSSADGTVEAKTGITGSGNPHSHGVTVDDSDPHSHAASTTTSNHMPPYYALCFVMKG